MNKKKDNIMEALCWSFLVIAFTLMVTGYFAKRDADIQSAQEQLNSIKHQIDSLQKQIDYIVE